MKIFELPFFPLSKYLEVFSSPFTVTKANVWLWVNGVLLTFILCSLSVNPSEVGITCTYKLMSKEGHPPPHSII